MGVHQPPALHLVSARGDHLHAQPRLQKERRGPRRAEERRRRPAARRLLSLRLSGPLSPARPRLSARPPARELLPARGKAGDEDAAGRPRPARLRSRPDALSAAPRRGRPLPRQARRVGDTLSGTQSAPAAARPRGRARTSLDPRRRRSAPSPGEYRASAPLPKVVSWRLTDDGFGNPEL